MYVNSIARDWGGRTSSPAPNGRATPSTAKRSISTSGRTGLSASRAGSTTTAPFIVANHRRPSLARQAGNCDAPLHSALRMPLSEP